MARRTAVYGWAAVIAGGVALAVVAGLALVRPWAGAAEPDPPASSSTPEPEPVAVLSAGAGDAPAPSPEGIAAAIDDLVRDGGEVGRVGAAVVDVATGEPLYRRDAGAVAIPASTTKLVTAAAVLASLDPTDQLATVAVAGAEPGEVVLVGAGDPTLAIDEDGFYPEPARLDRLADQVREALGRAPVRSVTVDSTLFAGPVHGPWDADIPGGGYVGPITALMTDGGRVDPDPAQGWRAASRWDQPDLAAGRAFASLLDADPDTVTRGEAPAAPAGPPATPTGASATPAGAPAPGTELGRVLSPPVQRLVEIMLSLSDNVVAEALARQVALARGEPASFDGAAAAMRATLAQDLGLADALAGVQLADGSGLSRLNQLTAALLTDLLTLAAGGTEPDLAGVVTGLPVAGWSGTLAERYQESEADPGAGLVRAKTGTLAGVSALAGLVLTADGRLLAFALLANAAPAGAPDGLDEIAATLAGCGCP